MFVCCHVCDMRFYEGSSLARHGRGQTNSLTPRDPCTQAIIFFDRPVTTGSRSSRACFALRTQILRRLLGSICRTVGKFVPKPKRDVYAIFSEIRLWQKSRLGRFSLLPITSEVTTSPVWTSRTDDSFDYGCFDYPY